LLRRTRRLFPFIEHIFADGGYRGKKMARVVSRVGIWPNRVGRPVAVVEPASPERLNFDYRKFCDHCHSRETRYALYRIHIDEMEAPMTTPVTSRVAIQARIAEWQRQYRNSDYGPADFLFGGAKSRADHLRSFQDA
jgi:hypothetical protein